MNGAELRKPGPIRRTIALVLGVALIGAGAWLAYQHLNSGEDISGKFIIAFCMMIGAGVLLLPTAIGR